MVWSNVLVLECFEPIPAIKIKYYFTYIYFISGYYKSFQFYFILQSIWKFIKLIDLELVLFKVKLYTQVWMQM